jgi:GWxTD domain-containing protein
MRFCLSKYGIIAITLYISFVSGCSTGYDTAIECYSTSQFQKYSLPYFTTYLMNVKSADDSRIDVYLQVPYKQLRFEKTGNSYKASYSLSFILRNADKEIIQTKELDRSVIAKTYEETISSRVDGLLQSFVLKPSVYAMEVKSVDHLSQLQYKQYKQIEAKRFSDSVITASTQLLLDTVIADSKGILLRPIFPSSLSLLNGSFGIFQELYDVHAEDTVTISESFWKTKPKKNNEGSFTYYMPPYRVSAERCSEEFDSMYSKIDSMFVVKKNGTQKIIQFFPLPVRGYNRIDRNIIISRQSSSDTIRLSEHNFVHDHIFPSFLTLQEIVAAMRYILREEEYDSIAIAEGEEKNNRINQFWESHGGLNRRKEFEQRMVEANALFTECTNGVETPMGMVFIICGVPDYIECRDGIIETWYYNYGEQSFSIPFRREKENSIYFTLQPFSVNESLWQYYIDRWRRK